MGFLLLCFVFLFNFQLLKGLKIDSQDWPFCLQIAVDYVVRQRIYKEL